MKMKIVDILSTQVKSLESLSKPYIIAEAGVNHEGNMDLAKRLIEEAAEGGAEAIKFQSYKANTLASKNSPSYWDLNKEKTKSQFKLFQKYDSFWKKEYEELKKYCDENHIEFLSTPFDKESANFLNDLMPVFKISSSDITNKPFIELIASFEKPIILSTGASTLSEIEEAVEWIENYGNPLSLLHCVLNYPTSDKDACLLRISRLIEKFNDLVIGYSDHTLPLDMKTCEIAWLLGAKIIEKHFTHDKSLEGNDHYHSMDKVDLKKFNNTIERNLSLLGDKNYNLINQKLSRKNARRSLVANCDITTETIIEEKHLTWKRPGLGISPKYIDQLIGMKSSRNIKEDEILQWEMFKK